MKHSYKVLISIVITLAGSAMVFDYGYAAFTMMELPVSSLGIEISVYDAISGELISRAKVTATDGIETLWLIGVGKCQNQGDIYYSGVYRPGTYTVNIQANGYQEHTIEEVVVEKLVSGGYIGLKTVFREIGLVPLVEGN